VLKTLWVEQISSYRTHISSLKKYKKYVIPYQEFLAVSAGPPMRRRDLEAAPARGLH